MTPEKYAQLYAVLQQAQQERALLLASQRLREQLADAGICPHCERAGSLKLTAYNDTSGTSFYKCTVCKSRSHGEDSL